MGDRVETRTLSRKEVKDAVLTSSEEKVLRMRHALTVGENERLGEIEMTDEVDRNYVAALEAKAVDMMRARAASKNRIVEKLRKK